MISNRSSQSGFALLMSLIVITIVLAIGLTILAITSKQLSLSSLARESEEAIYAASSGLECIQYHLTDETIRDTWLNNDDDPGNTDPPSITCVGQAPEAMRAAHNLGSERNVFNYQYEYNLPTGQCTEVSLYMLDYSNSTDGPAVATNEGLALLRCQAGNICTTVFTRGYNRPCTDIDALFTVQRELTLQL